jgi:hypothetical protein
MRWELRLDQTRRGCGEEEIGLKSTGALAPSDMSLLRGGVSGARRGKAEREPACRRIKAARPAPTTRPEAAEVQWSRARPAIEARQGRGREGRSCAEGTLPAFKTSCKPRRRAGSVATEAGEGWEA